MNDNPIPAPDSLITVNGITFTHGDIYKVIHNFYTRIQQDSILSVSFRSVHDWPEHIQRLTQFWWIRFGGRPYMFSEYNPVVKHFYAGFNESLLQRWLGIFQQTLNDNLTPEQSHLWNMISQRIGQSLLIKNELYLRNKNK